MNKHILELAYKAGYGTRWTSTEQFNQFMEKFAELLVRQCVSALDEAEGSVHHRECLFEHFGVEE